MTRLFLDMDDVVADFQRYASEKLSTMTQLGDRWSEKQWKILTENPRLYRDLEKTKDADRLVEFCARFCLERGLELMFLTAVPKDNDVHWAFYDKVLWARERFPDIAVMFGPFSRDKHTHCQSNDILIDDRRSNIDQWISAGGIGILYQGDVSKIIKALENL